MSEGLERPFKKDAEDGVNLFFGGGALGREPWRCVPRHLESCGPQQPLCGAMGRRPASREISDLTN